MNRLILPVAAAAMLTSCASTRFLPPTAIYEPLVEVVPLSYEVAWQRAVDWFAATNTKIEKLSRESGLITAKYLVQVGPSSVDCGKQEHHGIVNETMDRKIDINITVRARGAAASQVAVNVFGEYEWRGMDAMLGQPLIYRGRCVSTGRIERLIMERFK